MKEKKGGASRSPDCLSVKIFAFRVSRVNISCFFKNKKGRRKKKTCDRGITAPRKIPESRAFYDKRIKS